MRYIIGIDLGTTNCAAAYVDTSLGDAASPQILALPQLTAAGRVEERPLLPSFLYLASESEFSADALALPWRAPPSEIIGEFARQRGAEVPTRLIGSAKSWLSYGAIDRTAAILPWNSPEELSKRSPVDVSARYLAHIRAAWTAQFPNDPIDAQEVLLTVPASFDAVARELTLRAAREAGLPTLTLLEEPQAAFYAWLDAQGGAWRQAVHVGDVVLVCDIGGGTTDFTLIEVEDELGEMALNRIAVGNHILLGGDNMDLALAYRVREQLDAAGTSVDAWQFRGLVQTCRDAKERLLGPKPPEKHAVAIAGRGRKLVGGTLRTDVAREVAHHSLVDGFFPICKLDERPAAQRRTALQEIGLPYAADPAVTRHLASFLSDQTGNARRPTAVLFNGGVMRADRLRDRLVEVLASWFPADHNRIRVLSGADPEHAVARGAAYYGLARRGHGVRIRGGTARSYYIGIETSMPAVPGMRAPIKALCVVPQGVEEGTDLPMPEQEFGLVVGEPTEMRFLESTSRKEDVVGTVVESWNDEIRESAPLETKLDWPDHDGTLVPVKLEARVTEMGTLELWCVARTGGGRWKLEFNVRG